MLRRNRLKVAGSLLLLLVVTRLCFGQFLGLTTTNDGSRLYFSSTFRLRGSDEYLTSKIFMIDSAGAHLIDDQGSSNGDDYLDLYRPSVTGDGSLLVYTALSPLPLHTELAFPKTPPGTPNPFSVHDNGSVIISRNGRFGVLYPSHAGVGAQVTLIDLSTGSRTILTEPSIRQPGVASNGLVLISESGHGVLLINQNQVTLIDPDGFAASMSDTGTVIVYTKIVSGSQHGLLLNDGTSGNGVPLGPSSGDNYGPLVSGDGLSVIYFSTLNKAQQLFFIRTNGSELRQLTDAPEGIATATLSGDGKIAYAATNIGALFRIDTQTGDIQQLAAPVPYIENSSGAHAPGSLVFIKGARLASMAAVGSVPFRTELDGNTMTVAGLPAPLLSVSPELTVFQIPWDVAVDQRPPFSLYGPIAATRKAIVLAGGDPYFDAAFSFPVYAVDGKSVALGPFDPQSGFQPCAVHQDGTGLVTPASPAKSGEIVTIYALGLGAVSPSVANGVPTPFDPLSTITATLQFDFYYGTFLENKHPATVPFAGLTPGFIGLYQLNVLIPDDLPNQVVYLSAANFGSGPIAIGAP